MFRSAPYPEVIPGEPAKVTIGGFNIGVAKTTQHEDLAWDAVDMPHNEENQRNNAVNGGVPPVLARLYDDPEFQAVYPGMGWGSRFHSVGCSAAGFACVPEYFDSADRCAQPAAGHRSGSRS